MSKSNHYCAILHSICKAIYISVKKKKKLNSFLNFKIYFLRYFWSGLIVVLGIYLNLYSKNQKSWNSFFKKCYRKAMCLFVKEKAVINLYNKTNNI